jgi:thymidylate kinase
LIHVHAYTRLVIGSPWWAEYRLPLERALLDSAVSRPVFATPSTELELLVLVLATVLRFTPLHALRREPPRFLSRVLSEVERLEELGSREALEAALRRHLPEIDPELFDRCRRALDLSETRTERLATRLELGRRLASHVCRPPARSVARQIAHRAARERRGLAGGGAVVALLGGDGSGKSTCAAALVGWLQPDLATLHVHLGRPPRSAATLAIGAALKAARAIRLPRGVLAGLESLRWIGTARDRYRLYRRARRFAASGGIAICERYPVPENWALAGPSVAQGGDGDADSMLALRLRRWERRYYDRMTRPDLTFVLLLDGETAVQRKPGEPSEYVRRRAALTAEANWAKAGAIIVDAAQPLPQVLAALRSEIWRAL